MKLAGKVAMITGGGKGIGCAIALLFAKEGAQILLNGTTKEAIEAVAEEINQNGGRAIAYQADIADEENVKQMTGTALSEFGRIDVLVNNSGIAGPTASVVDVSLEDWQRTFDVNLTGTFLCTKYTLPGMIEQKSGCVLNITSVGGLGGYPFRSPYSASKWGMIGFTKTLALEVGRYNINANAIAPGPVRGPRIEAVLQKRTEQAGRSYEEMEQEMLGATALNRMVENEDIAAMALFLASEEGRNITGETINISGGMRL
jgi:NAD(P)-dependent dehydrogenase (short-subunit alcohol dehydrogenase family)